MKDQAVLLVNEAGDRFAPYFFDGAGAAPVQLSRGEDRSRMTRYGVSILPHGGLQGICVEKGRSDCEREGFAHSPLIVFFEVDRGGQLFAWNGGAFVERTLPAGSYDVSRARPADEHPLAQHPWGVTHKQMEPNPDLPTFQRGEGGR